MSRPDTSYLQKQIEAISAWRLEFQWLVDFGLSVEKAVNFGCDPAGKALGLMWAVEAEKLLGLDPSDGIMHQEESTLSRIQRDLRTYWDYLYKSDDVTEEDIAWWNEEVPDFFKQEMTKQDFFIDYITRDYTKFVNVPPSFFDLAFCDFVLHKIRWDKTRKDPAQDTRFVIGQMARLVRPGGIVAAFEWVQTGTFERLDFRRIFETCGVNLNVVHMHEERVDNWRGKGYAAAFICEKK
jgi:SAM-dependent methyltransferase